MRAATAFLVRGGGSVNGTSACARHQQAGERARDEASRRECPGVSRRSIREYPRSRAGRDLSSSFAQASDARELAQNERSSVAPGPVCAVPFQRAEASSTNSSGVGCEKPIDQSVNSRSRMGWFISSLIW